MTTGWGKDKTVDAVRFLNDKILIGVGFFLSKRYPQTTEEPLDPLTKQASLN